MELLCVPFIILGNIFSQNIIYNLLTHKVIKLQYKKYEILIFNYRNIDVNNLTPLLSVLCPITIHKLSTFLGKKPQPNYWQYTGTS